jgi:hypothetical protein
LLRCLSFCFALDPSPLLQICGLLLMLCSFASLLSSCAAYPLFSHLLCSPTAARLRQGDTANRPALRRIPLPINHYRDAANLLLSDLSQRIPASTTMTQALPRTQPNCRLQAWSVHLLFPFRRSSHSKGTRALSFAALLVVPLALLLVCCISSVLTSALTLLLELSV